ncbi:MAG: GNAT family N-acetyltransferase [Pirellulaceae bacterium]|nr:GNAT family N-acetyltransferase [Pirellulaceae bacterium]
MNTRTVRPVARLTAKRSKAPALAAVIARPAAPPTEGLRLLPARSGDHLAIHRLLLATFHGPSPAEFQAQTDAPGYDPADRLVVKDGEELAAHLRLSRATIHFGPATVGAASIMDLATAPEYRGRGLASALLEAAERRASELSIPLGLVRTRVPSLFVRQGWAVCGRHVFSTAGARGVLAQLGSTAEGNLLEEADDNAHCLLRVERPAIVIRPLRRIELPAAMRLYAQALPSRFGSPVRSEEFWEWLVNRGACDQMYVAAEGPEPVEFARQAAAIRGCVFVHEGRMVELLVEPGRDDVARRLVARVCADASEMNQWQVRLDAPPDDLLHGLFGAAGGQVRQAEELASEVFMAKVFDLPALLGRLEGVLAERARVAGLPRPVELGLEIQGAPHAGRTHSTPVERLKLTVGNWGTRLAAEPLGRHYLSLRKRDVAPLVLGHWNLPDLIDAGRIRASTKTARQVGRVLFPKLPWWRPPLDDLLS